MFFSHGWCGWGWAGLWGRVWGLTRGVLGAKRGQTDLVWWGARSSLGGVFWNYYFVLFENIYCFSRSPRVGLSANNLAFLASSPLLLCTCFGSKLWTGRQLSKHTAHPPTQSGYACGHPCIRRPSKPRLPACGQPGWWPISCQLLSFSVTRTHVHMWSGSDPGQTGKGKKMGSVSGGYMQVGQWDYNEYAYLLRESITCKQRATQAKLFSLTSIKNVRGVFVEVCVLKSNHLFFICMTLEEKCKTCQTVILIFFLAAAFKSSLKISLTWLRFFNICQGGTVI